MSAKREKGYGRHRFFYRLLRWPVKQLVKLKFNYTAEEAAAPEGPYIVLANHTTNWDPLLVGCAFRRYMYFVASEHIFRWGWLSRLIVWLVAPIARTKGTTDGAAAMAVLRTVKRGRNVCIFPEGNMSWSGVTGELHPTTARIVKASGASLVTFRISGGYLTSPRWTILLRKGRMSGRAVNVYTPEQIAVMTEEALLSAIEADIHENAFETQRREMVPFKGGHLAEKLETALYMCPKCGGVCTMHSEDSRFYCDCGFSVIYDHFGFFEGMDLPFETAYEWDVWQEGRLRETEPGDGPIYSDEDQMLVRIDDRHREHYVTEGTMELYGDRFVIGDFEIPLEKLFQIAVHGRETIVFSSQGVSYEVRSPYSRSGRKYMTMIGILAERAGAGGKATG